MIIQVRIRKIKNPWLELLYLSREYVHVYSLNLTVNNYNCSLALICGALDINVVFFLSEMIANSPSTSDQVVVIYVLTTLQLHVSCMSVFANMSSIPNYKILSLSHRLICLVAV